MTYRRKLIEVALPLDEINAESAREKSIRHGHPSTLHLWWARRPLAACRAVLFASLVDDPSNDLPEDEAQTERERLFDIIRDLVKWENSSDENVLGRARGEILRSTGGEPPPVLDPFCGGGSIPLEAQRLGLEAHGSDLNPVAVMITKALIELPPKFAGRPPVNPDARRIADLSAWRGAQGLAEDVRHYGAWMRDRAKERIGHLYPKGPDGETVIAWIWARTVRCPNPACGATMPLVRSFWLSKKKGKQAWVEPVIVNGGDAPNGRLGVQFMVKTGSDGPPVEGTVNRNGATCVVCDSAVPFTHIRGEGKAGRMGQQLMAVVAEGHRGRKYLGATQEHVAAAEQAQPEWRPENDIDHWAGCTNSVVYGLTTFADLFTSRQLVALGTFSDLVGDAHERTLDDALTAGLPEERAQAYANAVATYLAFTVDKQADLGNALNRWEPIAQCPRQLFARQAIPMTWDFAEGNPLGSSSGSWHILMENLHRALQSPLMSHRITVGGSAKQQDAADATSGPSNPLISSDPPYYDNVPYSNLSDFFYVWLRRSLGEIYPDLFGTMLVPRSAELVANQFRHGGKARAKEFFEIGLNTAFVHMRERADPDYPVTIYYAFKQTESERPSANGGVGGDDHGVLAVASTGWETMLTGLMAVGFQITGTWPIRTEMASRMRGMNSNALASSVVMVCRARPENAPVASRRDFQNALRRELPGALSVMIRENIAPVDLAQATIGPGMAIDSRYSSVLENDGTTLGIRTALQLINQQLDAVLAAQDGDLDGESRFCVAWYEQFGVGEGDYGLAETLSKAKNTSLRGLAESGVLTQRAGKVRLLKREELSGDWDPATDGRTNTWERTQHLVKAVLEGEQNAAAIVRKLGPDGAEEARQLAYRLYQICDRKKRPEEAFAYNALSQSWERILELSRQGVDGSLF